LNEFYKSILETYFGPRLYRDGGYNPRMAIVAQDLLSTPCWRRDWVGTRSSIWITIG